MSYFAEICAYCGNFPIVLKNYSLWHVECSVCDSITCAYYNRQKAIDAWNRAYSRPESENIDTPRCAVCKKNVLAVDAPYVCLWEISCGCGMVRSFKNREDCEIAWLATWGKPKCSLV